MSCAESFGSCPEQHHIVGSQPYLDYGVPVNKCYSENIIRLLVRDPEFIFVYWEIGEETTNHISLAIKIINLSSGVSELRDVKDSIGSSYFSVMSQTTYEAEIGIRKGGIFMPFAKSNKVTTPRIGTSKAYGSVSLYSHLSIATVIIK